MKKYGKKIAENKEVRVMVNSFLKKVVKVGVFMLIFKVQKVKVLKEFVIFNMVNKLQSGFLKQVDKYIGVQLGSGIFSSFLVIFGL